MKRIHFDSKGTVPWHYFFWEPWGCGGCLLRTLCFAALLALFLFLLSQFRSCRSAGSSADAGALPGQTVGVVVPPINDDDVVEEDGRRLVANRLNVLFGPECGQTEYESWCEQFHTLYPDTVNRVLFYDPDTKLMAIQVDASRRTEMLESLNSQIPDIDFLVFEEDVMETALHPNDYVFRNEGHSYAYDMVKAYDAWDMTTGSPSVIVAIVDSYFDLDHPDLSDAKIISKHSVANGTDDVSLPSDYDPHNAVAEYIHGTCVASLALGRLNDGKSVAGLAPDCSFMPISLGGTFGSLAMAQGVLYAINHGATVINVSAGSYFTDEILSLSVSDQISLSQQLSLDQQRVWDYIFDMCQRNYITIVWAAGNQDVFCGLDSSKRNAHTIRVSAVEQNMKKADFSNFGNFAADSIYESTLSAPGVQVAAALPGTTGYTLVDGTSFSSPIVAGCVGLVKSIDATMTTDQIITLLQGSGVAPRGNEASTIGPVIQIGPALAQLDSRMPTYTQFVQAIAQGSGSYHLGGMWYLNSEDSTALPPIYTISIEPTGRNSGEVRYTDNRTPVSSFKAQYTARVDGSKLILTVAAASRVEGTAEAVAGTDAKLTFEADGRGKATLTDLDADWTSNSYSCMVLAATSN